jgi:hypothetical protein
MKHRDQRKFLQHIRALSRERGLEMAEDQKSGSHKGLIIRDETSGERITVVIADHREISPGVQREVLKFLAGRAAHSELAKAAYEIFKRATQAKEE